MAQKNKGKNRYLSLILVVALILGILPAVGIAQTSASVAPYDGTAVAPSVITADSYTSFGLEEDGWEQYNGWYAITSAAELYGFAQLVNGGESNANAVLLQDVALNDGTVTESGSSADTTYSWTPIGTDWNNPYLGTFDGNGKTVSGLYISDAENRFLGLFGVVGSEEEPVGEIRNVTLNNSYIKGVEYVGGIVSFCYGNIIGCKNYAAVSNGGDIFSANVGGIVGQCYGDIENCENFGTVGGAATSVVSVGGVAAYCHGVVKGCVNNAAVSCGDTGASVVSVGGVVGSGCGNIIDCGNTASVGAVNAGDNVGIRIGGIVGSFSPDVTASGCYNTGNVSASATGEQSSVYCGGIVGDGSSARIENCRNTGAVDGSLSAELLGAVHAGGIMGSASSGVSFASCYNIGSVTGSNTAASNALFTGGIVGYANDDTVIEKCYYLAESETDELDGTTFAVEAAFKSGEVAWQLNGSSSDGVWKQTINKDNAPNFTGHTVYRDEQNSTYYNIHTYENGFCTDCADCTVYEQPTLKDGVYEIANAGQLYWFAALVNGTLNGVNKNVSAKGKLVDNIVVNSDVLNADGTLNENHGSFRVWTPMGLGVSSNFFKGSFDGGNYTISGLYFNDGSQNGIALFANAQNAVIENVGIIDSYFYGDYQVAAIAGYARDCTISKCFNTSTICTNSSGYEAAGIVGRARGTVTITNCYNTGAISGENRVAGIVGDLYYCNLLTVKNCYNAGKISANRNSGAILARDGGDPLDFSGCYYLQGTSAAGKGTVTAKSAADFKSGEVAWMLNGEKADGVWKQTINTDAYPNFTGETVYQTSPCVSYSNKGTEKAHNYENDFCTDCGQINETALSYDGFYEINSLEKLLTFADIVNNGQTQFKGRLTDDIDASSVTAIGIGASAANAFAGTFDGNGKTLKIALQSTAQYAAPFPYVNGATIMNLTVTGTITTSTKFASGIIGRIEGGDVRLEQCLSLVEITSTISGSDHDGTHGGLVAVANSGTLTISACGFAGAMYGASTTSCGGLVGWSNMDVSIYNSYVAAKFELEGNSGNTFVRNPGKIKELVNCYYLNALSETPTDGAEQASATAFMSGEVAWKLNTGNPDGAWKQTIKTDNVPNFSGAAVKRLETSDGPVYYNEDSGVVDVEISWTSMAFTYTDGEWNADLNDYDDGAWSTEGGTVTVNNNGAASVNATLTYTSELDGVHGGFDTENMPVPAGESRTAVLTLEGKPSEALDNAPIGTITVVIAAAVIE